MNTTYTANENCFLIDGEVYAGFIPEPNVDGMQTYSNLMIINGNPLQVTHSTNKYLDNIVLLPRDKFVKPKDVEALARRQSQIIGSNGKSRLVDLRFHFVMGFKAGHNANPNEFTREEMINAMNAVHNNPLIILDIPAYINHLRPLSLPERLEINEQGEILNVIW